MEVTVVERLVSTSTYFQSALDTIARLGELVIRHREDQDANVELLRGALRRAVIHPEHYARGLLAAASARFDALADAADNLHERGFWARAQEQTARYAATLAYVRTLEDGIPESWEHVYHTRPEVDQAEAVITWHGDLIRSYAMQAASEKVARLANETITMLREKREKLAKEDGSIAARNVIARLGKGEMRTDAGLREQVLNVLVSHRHLIPLDTARPQGPLRDCRIPFSRVLATFATSWGEKGEKVAEVANYAPTDKVG